jgi:hypothetical protein
VKSRPEALPPAVDRVRTLLVGAPFPWWVAGGWAIDLWLGRETRAHSDVDVAVLRRDQQHVREWLGPGWRYEVALLPTGTSGRRPWPAGETLEPPVHEIHADHADGGPVELLLNESDGKEWAYPVLAPEVVLLYKSKAPRPHDDHDLGVVWPSLHPERRAWLGEAVRVAHPDTPWLRSLALSL